MIDLKSLAEPGLPAEVLEHLPAAEASAAANSAKVNALFGKEIRQVFRQSQELLRKPSDTKTKMVRLRFFASQWTELVSQESACRKGCSHCCNVPVSLSRTEAKLIASKTGAEMRNDAGKPLAYAEKEDIDKFTGVPCTFLAAGRCSIYEHRPLACRTLVNMDSTDLLCKLVPDAQVPVPYGDSTPIKAAYAIATLQEDHADIREWFGHQAHAEGSLSDR